MCIYSIMGLGILIYDIDISHETDHFPGFVAC